MYRQNISSTNNISFRKKQNRFGSRSEGKPERKYTKRSCSSSKTDELLRQNRRAVRSIRPSVEKEATHVRYDEAASVFEAVYRVIGEGLCS